MHIFVILSQDRMDCQLLMLAFTTVHYNTFIATQLPSVEALLVGASQLTYENQVHLYEQVTYDLYLL